MPNSQHIPQPPKRPRIVIVGAGFAGLAVARGLARTPVDVTLLDRNNYYAFWPLLYQVATAGLEPQQIAYPIRAVVRRLPNVNFRIARVERVDLQDQHVITDNGVIPYDELVLAAGSANNFFGIDSVEAHGFGFKELPEAMALRNHLIMSFEHAAYETDPEQLQRLLTFVVVGGGPTGVELAGATAELIRYVLRKDYPHLDFRNVRVMLIEMLDQLLPAFPAKLGRAAERKLKDLGIEVCLETSVTDLHDDTLYLKGGREIPTRTVIWAAGVQGAALAQTLDVPLAKGRRLPVTPTLQLQDQPHIWVVGDLAYLEDQAGKPFPQLATVALQQGQHVAANIRSSLQGHALKPFRYRDKGSMATVGRSFAVASIWRLNWSGFTAWVLWLVVHLLYLLGLRNRLLVLINWAYSYITYDRAVRAIVAAPPRPQAAPEAAAVSAATEAAR